MTRRGALALAAIPWLSGCGHYAAFTLPVEPGGDPSLSFELEALPQPVLSPGAGWDSHDALNPAMVDGHNMLYSGFDGHTWRTGMATSADGIFWRKHGMVLEPDARSWEGDYIAANGAAVSDRGQLWYWYVAGPRELPQIGLWRMAEERRGPRSPPRREPRPVLEAGPYGSWEERGVADPYVIRIGAYFYLYYLGQDRARRQRLGLARSADGVRWEKLRANPILELGGAGAFDENGLGEPAVWEYGGSYWMLYTGRDAGENRRLGLARSTDGVGWKKLPAVFSGAEAWDSKVMCDPSVVLEGPQIRVWFGGGDVARPDENLHGQIGLAILKPVGGG
ncbi:MAG: hypothetical protein ACLQU1_34255 [Bryobacteraceae bacterium]